MDYNKMIDECSGFLKDYVKQAKMDGVVVGLSGGIDSSVASVLAVKALGRENVLGIMMPCGSNPVDLNSAMVHANQFQIPYITVALDNTYDTMVKSFPVPLGKLAKANLKARLRGSVLYSIANSNNLLVLGTCNKSEISIGYETKGGDQLCDISLIGEIYKFEVRQLANQLNINQNIITKPPSAGLWNGQTDENELGMSYETLDDILTGHMNHPNKIIQKVDSMMKNSQHKREMPPTWVPTR